MPLCRSARRTPMTRLRTAAPIRRLLPLVIVAASCGAVIVSGEEPDLSRENKAEVLIDSVRILPLEQALKLEAEIQRAYAKLSASVVRLWNHNEDGLAFDEQGEPTRGRCSGVIIDAKGLILTCSHHGKAPG